MWGGGCCTYALVALCPLHTLSRGVILREGICRSNSSVSVGRFRLDGAQAWACGLAGRPSYWARERISTNPVGHSPKEF